MSLSSRQDGASSHGVATTRFGGTSIRTFLIRGDHRRLSILCVLHCHSSCFILITGNNGLNCCRISGVLIVLPSYLSPVRSVSRKASPPQKKVSPYRLLAFPSQYVQPTGRLRIPSASVRVFAVPQTVPELHLYFWKAQPSGQHYHSEDIGFLRRSLYRNSWVGTAKQMSAKRMRGGCIVTACSSSIDSLVTLAGTIASKDLPTSRHNSI